MTDKGEPVRWVTVNGARIPIFADGSMGIGTKDSTKKTVTKEKTKTTSKNSRYDTSRAVNKNVEKANKLKDELSTLREQFDAAKRKDGDDWSNKTLSLWEKLERKAQKLYDVWLDEKRYGSSKGAWDKDIIKLLRTIKDKYASDPDYFDFR